MEQAKRKYTAIEQAAFEAGLDITVGAELRRAGQTPGSSKYNADLATSSVPDGAFTANSVAPDLQMTRIDVLQRAMQRDPMALMEKFVPMFLNGLNRGDKQKTAV